MSPADGRDRLANISQSYAHWLKDGVPASLLTSRNPWTFCGWICCQQTPRGCGPGGRLPSSYSPFLSTRIPLCPFESCHLHSLLRSPSRRTGTKVGLSLSHLVRNISKKQGSSARGSRASLLNREQQTSSMGITGSLSESHECLEQGPSPSWG